MRKLESKEVVSCVVMECVLTSLGLVYFTLKLRILQSRKEERGLDVAKGSS